MKTVEKAVPKIPPTIPDNTPSHLIPRTNPLPSATKPPQTSPTISGNDLQKHDVSFSTFSFEPWKENIERKVGYDQSVAKVKALTAAIKQPMPSFEKHHLNLVKTSSENALMIIPSPKKNPLVPYVFNTQSVPIEKFIHGGNPTGNLLLQKMLPTFTKGNPADFKDVQNKFEILLQESKKDGYSHVTTISATTKINDIPLEQLLLEAYVRKIIKVDKGHTVCTLITENDTPIILGQQPYGVKTTPLYEALKNQISIDNSTIVNNQSFDLQQLQLLCITKNDNDAVIQRGTSLHINIGQKTKQIGVFDPNTKTYKLLGYLTSQKVTGSLFSDKQFKVYQQEMFQGATKPSSPGKQQYFVLYTNLREINEQDVIVLKGGTEYINTCNAKKNLEDYMIMLSTKKIVLHTPTDASVTDLLMICQQFDKNKADNKPQPLSAFQIKKIEENNTNMKKTLANNIPKNNEPQQNPTDI